MTSVADARRRVLARVHGAVQGVGFRPFVFRLAHELALGGYARNDVLGLTIEIEGRALQVEQFLGRLVADAPPLAVVESVTVDELPIRGDADFVIAESAGDDAEAMARVTPDVATCDACLRELFDPADRRYRYPFINCTDCGPRFTIVRGVPYDRARTTMASFLMCAACQREYDTPSDRRFHAQPNACRACGPAARFVDRHNGSPQRDEGDPVALAARWLNDGAIIAVKGLGGFHLACRADDGDAVARLRARKHREDKPFAVMVRSRSDADRLAQIDAMEGELLVHRQRPIVLVRRRESADIAPAVAPGQRDVGILLPATPLHHLLLADAGRPLVMTSGNRSSEPIAFVDEDALDRLDGIADAFLLHDRPIETRVDDSVLRVITLGGARRPLMIRRSRGWVPSAVPVPVPCSEPILATGGQLKNTFTIGAGSHAWVGHHIGDLDDPASREAFRAGILHFERFLAVTPRLIAHDLHPDYHATHYAQSRDAEVREAVQHHHAHLASVLGEHGEQGPALGILFDGTGYGSDGTVWGGEFLGGSLAAFERLGHLHVVPLPGGEAAIHEPWRMACAWLCALDDADPPLPPALAGAVEQRQWEQVVQLTRRRMASPMTTSVGRLLDAIASLCGVRARVTYEGQAAIELEMRAAEWMDAVEGYEVRLRHEGGTVVVDPRPLIRGLLADLEDGVPVARIARRAHEGIADASAQAALEIARAHALTTVALGGGVFQNVILLEGVAERLDAAGLRVLVPRQLPPNDGGLSYGQLVVAAARAAAPMRTLEMPLR